MNRAISSPSLVHEITASDTLFEQGSHTLKLLAEPTRLHLLWLLSSNEYTVTELVELTHAPRTAVSQHLAKLRAGNLVHCRKSGRHVIYRVSDGHLMRLVQESINHADHIITGEPAHE